MQFWQLLFLKRHFNYFIYLELYLYYQEFIYQIKMINVAVLDDYQNAFRQIIDLDKYKDKFNFVTFNEPFLNEDDVVQSLETIRRVIYNARKNSITKNIINGLPKLKYIITSGMRNNSIDLKSAKEKKLLFVALKLIQILLQN